MMNTTNSKHLWWQFEELNSIPKEKKNCGVQLIKGFTPACIYEKFDGCQGGLIFVALSVSVKSKNEKISLWSIKNCVKVDVTFGSCGSHMI